MVFALPPLSSAETAALAFLVLAWAGMGWLIENPPARRPSASVLMQDYRREWMRQLVTRQPRIFDANVIDNLRQASAFFASACLIAIGGGVALLGNTDQLARVALEIAPEVVGVVPPGFGDVEIKVIVALLFVANALLKFIWTNRLFGYCAVLMAAVPNDPADPLAYHRASQAAEVNITAARGFNRGLHSVYFALAALTFLLGAVALVVAVLLTLGVLGRREFASDSRAVMLRRYP